MPFDWDTVRLVSVADLKESEKRMKQEIKDAIAKLNSSVSAEIKAITDRLNQPDTDTAEVVAALNQVAATLDSETAVILGTTPVTSTV